MKFLFAGVADDPLEEEKRFLFAGVADDPLEEEKRFLLAGVTDDPLEAAKLTFLAGAPEEIPLLTIRIFGREAALLGTVPEDDEVKLLIFLRSESFVFFSGSRTLSGIFWFPNLLSFQ